jgi:hypothetical protein
MFMLLVIWNQQTGLSNGLSINMELDVIKKIESNKVSILNLLQNKDVEQSINLSNSIKTYNNQEMARYSGDFVSLNALSSQFADMPAYANAHSRPFTAVFVPNGNTLFKLDLPADFGSSSYFNLM